MRRRRLLRAWLLGLLPVLVLAAVGAGLLVLHRGPADTPDRDQDRPGTVLLVAGYGGGQDALGVLAGRLRAAGRKVVVVPPVGDNTGDLKAQADQLDRVAKAQIAAGAPSVDVVGYSAGGIVVRAWVARGGGALTRRVVTLGSPHHGTDLAGAAAGLLPGACPVACHQLAPGSDLLTGLPQVVDAGRWTSVWTADDQTVVPANSAVLQGALNVEVQQVCAGQRLSHGGLPADPLVAGLVKLALDGPVLAAAPGPARCAAIRAAGLSS